MNCQKFESIVGELARGRIIGADIRQDALVHTGDCPRCALRFRNEDMLTRALQMLALETESAQAPNRIEGHLLQAFREQKLLQPVYLVNGRLRYWVSAAAAVLLIVASVIAIRWRTERPVAQPATFAVGHTEGRVPEKLPVAIDRLRGPTDNVVKYLPTSRKPGRRSESFVAKARSTETQKKANGVAANNVTGEIATEFMPLGYLNAANLQDGGQMVRVALPRSAMASFGLPVNMDRYNETVKADVLLGVDGVAHAIRFVQ